MLERVPLCSWDPEDCLFKASSCPSQRGFPPSAVGPQPREAAGWQRGGFGQQVGWALFAALQHDFSGVHWDFALSQAAATFLAQHKWVFYLASQETKDRERFLVVEAFGPFLLVLAVGEYFSPKAGERCVWITGPAKHRGLGLISRAPRSYAAGEVWKWASPCPCPTETCALRLVFPPSKTTCGSDCSKSCWCALRRSGCPENPCEKNPINRSPYY